MDYVDVTSRVEALRLEVAEIADHNRKYAIKKYHSPRERAERYELRERVHQIRAELFTMRQRSRAGGARNPAHKTLGMAA